MNTDRVDIAIIGNGPAGVSAAVNAKIRNKSFILFGSKNGSASVGKSISIKNYPGFCDISGAKFNKRLDEQLKEMEIDTVYERITGIYDMGGYFAMLADKKQFEADTVILATGAEVVKALPGERELLGRGVSYCATCDGNLYKGKKIAVICDSEADEHEVSYLAELAETVYYFPMFKSSLKADNIIVLSDKPVSVEGEQSVSRIVLKNNESVDVDGVFFLKQSISADVLLNGIEMDDGHIRVDRTMATSVQGCFAAGDCTGRPYQIAKAVGEGNVACHSAIEYLAKK